MQQNLWHGLTARFNYSYSHATDNVSNGGVLAYSEFNSILNQINPANPNASYASADYDLRHQLSANYVWDLPVKVSNHWLQSLLGGWQIAGTFFYRTGFPFSIVDGQQEANLAGNNLTANGTFLPGVLFQPTPGSPTSFGASCATTACFTSSSFATPADFNANARNAFRGPGYFNTDMNLKKSFSLNERMKFTLGANFFNILNHPNFQNPVSNDQSSSFGMITAVAVSPTTPYGAFAAAAEGMRIVQVFGKINF